MIDQPTQATLPAQQVASIRLHIPVQNMRADFPAALDELSTALTQQGIPPTGPVFAHHFRRPTDTFDFQVCIPAQRPVLPVGRVQPVALPAFAVLRTTYHGDYAGLPHAWGDFIAAIPPTGPAQRGDFVETYLVGPRDNPDSTQWRTGLSVILADGTGASA